MDENKLDIVTRLKEFCRVDGQAYSLVDGVQGIQKSQVFRHAKQRWKAAVYLIVQGKKEIILGDQKHLCKPMHYAVALVDLPLSGRVLSVNEEKPFLCLKIEIDFQSLTELGRALDQQFPQDFEVQSRGMLIGKIEGQFLASATRLVQVMSRPGEAEILGPLIKKEIFYHLLTGPDGYAIRQFLRSGKQIQNITKAVECLHSGLSQAMDVASLAKTAGMSRSAFFTHFKEMTAMSPVQYRKRLRLLEAKRLLTEEQYSVENSAFRVGYKSASQFSREYSRMFGMSPKASRAEVPATDTPLQPS